MRQGKTHQCMNWLPVWLLWILIIFTSQRILSALIHRLLSYLWSSYFKTYIYNFKRVSGFKTLFSTLQHSIYQADITFEWAIALYSAFPFCLLNSSSGSFLIFEKSQVALIFLILTKNRKKTVSLYLRHLLALFVIMLSFA